MNPLISVIVPVYNVEDYLDRCVDSIVNQTYKNLEIILVDDGSTDSSGLRCDEWAEKDKRIVVIHKKNGGLSDARNVGMRNANGEYIGFVDSDDFIDPNMYQILLDIVEKTDSEIAECQWLAFENEKELDGYSVKNEENEFIELSTEEALKELIVEKMIKQTVVNKLYHRKLIIEDFPVGKINEDDFWTYQIIAQADRIVHINVSLYFYYQRSTSIMHVKYSPKRLDGVEARKWRMYFIKENFPRIFNYACLSFLWTCFYHYQVICRNTEIDTDNRFRNNLHADYCENYCKEAIKLMSAKQKIWMKSFKLFPRLTCNVRNILKIGL